MHKAPSFCFKISTFKRFCCTDQVTVTVHEWEMCCACNIIWYIAEGHTLHVREDLEYFFSLTTMTIMLVVNY